MSEHTEEVAAPPKVNSPEELMKLTKNKLVAMVIQLQQLALRREGKMDQYYKELGRLGKMAVETERAKGAAEAFVKALEMTLDRMRRS